MSRPLFAPENFFNRVQFPLHTVSATEEPTGNEAFRVGTGRRSALNFATSTSANALWSLKVACNKLRAADFIAIDRGFNLTSWELQGSNDDFTTYETILSVTMPTVTVAPSNLNTAPGVLTEEGAWLRRFPTRVYRYWRIYVPAMGTGLRPQITGAYLGLSWEPEFLQALPFTYGARNLIYTESESDTAWVGSSRPAQRYETDIVLKMESWDEYDLARRHIEQGTWRKRHTWYVPNQARAERSWLGVAPPGKYRFEKAKGWGFPVARFPLVEYEPKLI